MVRDDHLKHSRTAQPKNARVDELDPRVAMCDIDLFRDAWLAFSKIFHVGSGYHPLIFTIVSLNDDYQWHGKRIHCILQCPNGDQLVHPNIEPAKVTPLKRIHRTGSSYLSASSASQPPISPYGNRGRDRNMSLSSISSQSSVGSLTPPSPLSPRSHGYPAGRREPLTWERVDGAFPAAVNTTTGSIRIKSAAAGDAPSCLPINHYEVILIRSNQHFQGPTSPTFTQQPRLVVPTERRSIIIRNVDDKIEQAQLEAFLRSQGVQGWRHCQVSSTRRCYAFVEFGRHIDAIEAVRKLNGKDYGDRRLNVELRTEEYPRGTHERAGSLASNANTLSSSGSIDVTERRRRSGPNIVNGDV